MKGAPESRGLAARILPVLLLAVAAYYAVWGGEYSAWDLYRLHDRKADAAQQLAATRQRVDSLRNVAKLLDHDSATIEAVARERFGMLRDGELLYRFVTVRPEEPSAVAAWEAEPRP
ncbi:MAG TPA: septum formation initiator family protein [Longimicrobiaceae bacterium]|nr:septum formation initiator family protein [Longimicrobiaceae bacterium]